MPKKDYSKLNTTLVNNLKNKVNELKKANKKLSFRLKFEKTLSTISSRFISLKNIDKSINKSLKDMGKLSKASRAYIFIIDKNNKTMSNTHEWCAKGVSSQIKNLQNIPVDSLPWWMEKLRNREIIHIKSISDLPKKAKKEKKILQDQNIKSLLVLPLYIKNKLSGFLGFDNVKETGSWKKEDIALLNIASDLFGNAFKRKETEKKLKESKEKYKFLYNKAHTLNCIIGKDRKIKDINKFFADFLGYKKENIIGKNVLDFVVPRHKKKLLKTFKKAFKNKESPEREFDIIAKDGSIKPVYFSEGNANIYENGELKGILATGVDITERKEKEKKLKEHQKIFQIAAEFSTDLVWIWDVKKGSLDWFGDIDKILGYKKNKFPRTIKAWKNIIHPDDKKRVLKSLDKSIKNKEPYIEKYKVKTKDNKILLWLDKGKALYDDKGKAYKMVGVIKDITEEKNKKCK